MFGSPEKPMFKRTCSLLSQYLKEKGSFGDLTLGITCSHNVEKGMPEIVRPATETRTTTMDLFPQGAGFSADNGSRRVGVDVDPQNAAAPMTIFYCGQVIVFNDFPADKAKEIMALASKCSSENPKTNTFVPGSPNESGLGVHSNSNDQVPNIRTNLPTSRECVRPIPGDLPIARRASLHRFLEKRKDRITSKAPYPINGSAGASPPKPGNSKPWLGLAVESLQ
ncbi:hypothetical protein ERO13_D08G267400v2 [Gossypium hirsutum]|uniref:Protein TIFY n=1 Tax=Gossypium hirsutum TaxID=3635 RepID=A0A1U8M0P4_GOSHI|nr:protein TIFY 10A [Gossypium hirsutum]KAG4136221.1 hypothetical protein ERO13_D08G267400v2 [Gossypium hirsutum]